MMCRNHYQGQIGSVFQKIKKISIKSVLRAQNWDAYLEQIYGFHNKREGNTCQVGVLFLFVYLISEVEVVVRALDYLRFYHAVFILRVQRCPVQTINRWCTSFFVFVNCSKLPSLQLLRNVIVRKHFLISVMTCKNRRKTSKEILDPTTNDDIPNTSPVNYPSNFYNSKWFTNSIHHFLRKQ